MALFAVAMLTGVRLLRQPTRGRAAWHALACAAAIDVRVMALVLPVATLGWLGLRVLGSNMTWRTAWQVAGLYGGLLSGLVLALWPYLWAAPWTNLQLAFRHMSVYGWDNTVLYRGATIKAAALPWHYALVWISITTPIMYLGALLVGLGATGRLLLNPRHWSAWGDEENQQDLFFTALLVVPLLAVIVLKSVLYDGWWHLYFVYPALLLVALRGWVLVWHWLHQARLPRFASLALSVATGLSMTTTAYQIVAAHPNQQVYFNQLAGRNVATTYELDYWGLSFRQGLEYITAHDTRPRITVMANAQVEPVARLNWNLLPAADRQRLEFTKSVAEADYFISNYRWHPGPYAFPHEVHRVMVNNLRILSVFKLK